MTKYDTNNPIGSPSVKDVNDNSINFDHATNNRSSETWQDRLGAKRKTWHGIEKDNERSITEFKQESNKAILAAGYAPVGTFQEGAKVEALNEVVLWRQPDGDGENYKWIGPFPKTVPANSTPASTGGIKTESNPTGLWVSVGDASLRQDLNKGTGANLVRTNSGQTVEESLNSLGRKVDDNTVTTTIPPELPPIDNTKTKLFIKNFKNDGLSDYYVVTRKANGARGYVAMGLTRAAAAADSANTGGKSPIRTSEVLSLSEAFVGYFTPLSKNGSVTVSALNAESLRLIYGVQSLLQPERLMIHNKGQGEINFSNPQCYMLAKDASIIYPVFGNQISVHLGTSAGSSENVTISTSSDGVTFVTQKTVNLTSEGVGRCVIKLDIDYHPKAYVKIENKSASGIKSAYVVGLNIQQVEECTVNTQYDCAMIASNGTISLKENKYINGAGANEFAAHENNGKWFGTYHGGHSNFLQRIAVGSSRYNVDEVYDALPDSVLSSIVQLHSISNITVGSTVYSYTASTTWGEGAHVTNYSIQLKSGDPIVCNRVFVNMCCTAPDFNWVHHPILLEGVSGYQDITIGQTGFVEQYQAGSTKTLRNYFSQVPMVNNVRGGCYISYQAIYSKIYYGLVLDKLASFFGGSFITCKTYS
ncbi:hypothetical protein [Providencia sp. PROV147]|uniref:tail fiber/spike domain-containing protein n=1 Tax=Providencia sp. PROV147 TaxID=2949857 RepID=UPI00234A1F11|nr:hypothetical protein [Providencia sp. PROV147]